MSVSMSVDSEKRVRVRDSEELHAGFVIETST